VQHVLIIASTILVILLILLNSVITYKFLYKRSFALDDLMLVTSYNVNKIHSLVISTNSACDMHV